MTEQVEVGRFSTPGSTGNVDWTTTDLGGETPVACIIVGSFATTDGVARDGLMWGVGFCDDTSEGCMAAGAGHNDAPADLDRSTHNAKVISFNDSRAPGDVDATFVSFITNGVRLNFSDLPATAELYTVYFFAGSGVSAYMTTVNPGNISTTTSITGAGWQADFVALATGSRDGTATSGTLQNSFGFAKPGSADVCYAVYHLGGSTPAAVVSVVRSNRCLAEISTSGGGSTEWGLTSSTNANGVDLNVVDGNCNEDVHALLIKFDSIAVEVGSFDSPTSTGIATETGPGIEPQAVLLGLTAHTSVDTVTASSVAGFGMGAFTPDAEFCNSWADEDAANPSNTQSLSDNTAVNLADHAGSNLHTAAFDSMAADGFALDYSAANGARKWFYAAFESMTAPVPVGQALETESALPLDSGATVGAGLTNSSKLNRARLVA